jgi:steroid delta-isomerase-like uncharacterized protein
VEAENLAVVRRVIDEAWNRGNLEVLDELVAANYVGHDPNIPHPSRGPAGFKESVMTARTTFADFQITVEDLVAAEDRVAGRITMRGTHRGALAGLPPTGKSVEFSGMFVRRLEGGQFVEGWGITDLFGLLRQIGAIPMPG